MYLSQIFSLGLWLVFSFSVNVFFRGRHIFKVMCLGISGQGAVANTWFTFFLTHPQLLGIYYFAVSIGFLDTDEKEFRRLSLFAYKGHPGKLATPIPILALSCIDNIFVSCQAMGRKNCYSLEEPQKQHLCRFWAQSLKNLLAFSLEFNSLANLVYANFIKLSQKKKKRNMQTYDM